MYVYVYSMHGDQHWEKGVQKSLLKGRHASDFREQFQNRIEAEKEKVTGNIVHWLRAHRTAVSSLHDIMIRMQERQKTTNLFVCVCAPGGHCNDRKTNGTPSILFSVF